MINSENSNQPEELLIWKYRSVGTMSGSELLLQYPNALRFVDDCVSLNLVILGMDFYVIEDGFVSEVGSTGWSDEWAAITSGPGAARRAADAVKRQIREGLPYGATWVSFITKEEDWDKKSDSSSCNA